MPSLPLYLDFSVQPYSIGDTLLAIAAANAEADGRGVDVVLVADSRVQHEDENMRAAHSAPMESLGKLLPLLELVHGLGSVSIHTKGSPERWQYQTYRAIQTIAKCRAPYALLNFSPELCKWADDFLAKCGPRVVTVNLRNNTGYHFSRNADLGAWREAMGRARETLGVSFCVVGETGEVPAGFFSGLAVVAKERRTTLLDDLALVHRSKAHIGTCSGPMMPAMLGDKPYFFTRADMRPHLSRYGGALREVENGHMAFSWATERQRLCPEQETVSLLVDAIGALVRP